MPKTADGARITESVVVKKYDGDPPTPECPKDPVEIVFIERRDDNTSTTIITKKEQGPCLSHDSA